MKKSALTHIIWALVAVCNFVVGSYFFSNQGGERTEIESQRLRISTRSSESGGLSQSRKARETSTEKHSPSKLGEKEIQLLGGNFRDAKDPISRRIAFAKILEVLTAENAILLREQIAHLPQDSAEFREFHYAWGGIAGNDAVTHSADTPKMDMAASLAGWANSDPNAALAFFNSLPPGRQSDAGGLKWGAAYGLADSHPELALQFAATRLKGGDKDAGKMAHIVVDALIKQQNPEALANLTKDLPRGHLLDSIGYRVAKEIGDQDPVKAFEWTNSLPQTSGKFKALGATFERWADHDPVEAARQIPKLPENQRNSATYGFASRVAHEDAPLGVEWASTITVEKTRNAALLDAGRTYFRKDPAGAAQWLPTSGLPPAMQQQLLERANRGRK